MAKWPQIRAGSEVLAALLDEMLPEVIVKDSNTSRASTATATLDPELQFTGEASGIYLIEFNLMPAATTTADFKTKWEVPSGSSGLKTALGPGSTASDGDADNIAMRAGVHLFSTEVLYSGVRNDNSKAYLVQEFGVITLATAGTIGLSWAQNTSNATAAILYAGSWMRATRLG